jgi:protein CpxP
MKSIDYQLLVAVLAASLSLPAISFADHGCPYHMGDSMMRDHRMDHQAEQEKLHKLLNLTAAQEGAWKTFTETMKPPHDMAKHDSTDWSKLTTPERADRMLESSRKREQQMEANVAAMKTFYAKLTPAQQKIFDDFHSKHMMKRHWHKAAKPATGKQDTPASK